jgi:hypothetical protein
LTRESISAHLQRATLAEAVVRFSRLSRCLLALACLALAGPAAAVSFGPLPVIPPSGLTPEAGPGQTLAGSIALDVASVPVVAPTLLALTDVSVTASGGATFALDPAVASPGIGAVQPSGDFLIPTLFLRVTDGPTSFDLAVPNVAGSLLFDGAGNVLALAATFEVDSLSPAGVVTVSLLAGVPEPGTVVLLALGLGAIALKKEGAR